MKERKIWGWGGLVGGKGGKEEGVVGRGHAGHVSPRKYISTLLGPHQLF